MKVYAAVDLRGGRVVQLVGGRPEDERVSLPDPAGIAADWVRRGFNALHVVDLDAALGTGSNSAAIDSVLRAAGTAEVQVGGGVRSGSRVAELLDRGATRVVAGTRAVQDRAWLERIVARHPGRVVVAADVRGSEVLTRGWTAASGYSIDTLLQQLEPLPLAAVLVTDVAREGGMGGIDEILFRRIANGTRHDVIASGGVASAADVVALERLGIAGVVLGMALYTGRITPAAVTGSVV
jgi:phosphoribosyl isomerase A